VDAVALSDDQATVYAGGYFTSIGGQNRNRIAALDAGTGAATAWDANANNNVYALAVYAGRVYAGGAFTFIGGQTRNHVAALDPSAATAEFSWDPNLNSDVYTLVPFGSSLYMGGAYNTLGGGTQDYLAALRFIPGNVGVADRPLVPSLALAASPNPLRGSGSLRFSLEVAGPVSLALFDVAGRRVTTLLDHQWLGAGPHTVALHAGELGSGGYFARLEAGGRVGTARWTVVR